MIQVDSKKWELACSLLREIMMEHADPESADYNECDKTPCYWCELAELAMEVN